MQSWYIHLYNLSSISLWNYIWNLISYTPCNCYCIRKLWIQTNQERYEIGKELLINTIKYSPWKKIGDPWKISSWKIFDKPRHGQIWYRIYLHVYLIGPIKSVLRKFLNTKIQLEAWLVMINWNMGGQEMFVIITKLGMELIWTQKSKSFILQQSWAGIERQTCIMG